MFHFQLLKFAFEEDKHIYCQTSDIRLTLVGNKIVH